MRSYGFTANPWKLFLTWVPGKTGVSGAGGNRSGVSNSVRALEAVFLENSHRPSSLGHRSVLLIYYLTGFLE